jgi:hypothetical protein
MLYQSTHYDIFSFYNEIAWATESHRHLLEVLDVQSPELLLLLRNLWVHRVLHQLLPQPDVPLRPFRIGPEAMQELAGLHQPPLHAPAAEPGSPRRLCQRKSGLDPFVISLHLFPSLFHLSIFSRPNLGKRQHVLCASSQVRVTD